MAQKRMFDRAIIDTDRFMDLSMSAKALYFLLGMEADDEGFVSYKKVMRIHGGNEDDIKVLLGKNFIIGFPSGVVVITDWNKNNYLTTNRIKPTEYQNEKNQLLLTEAGKYEFNACLDSIEESRGEERRITTGQEIPLKDKETESKKEKEGMFEIFWREYPNHTKKKDALSKWLKLNLKDGLFEKIMQAVRDSKESRQWKEGFIPHPTTWINGERWNDELKKENNKITKLIV